MITFEEFKKIDLCVARVLHAERVDGSEKLIRLEVDAGDVSDADIEEARPAGTVRQIVAGIGLRYQPEELVGKNIIIVANLEPRTLMGQVSSGMLLAAAGDGPVLLTTAHDVAPGARIT
ncbi:MAG: hypothetical protein A3I44_06260 [Candidatus Sungbacteria bacterium RIFCSPLOWO2_02_FULL_51_17]|uniref:tRNA-binding domain-containing protein n=1 Tax=Candidatus Sungbacteria bacterium RIFCSPHIGHO2_02_FULL_51_29 TaxID=1802273 RepID=A0A1G2KQC5_9BACT|nr:MAG: hypothetical protein A2676_04575 [Candidatus Sungbacteria bacterium RIFCSPHIGHO2_01_FULL_51_22]OHA01627.1 MAG: hypothetical protein A3C16_02635 [Candidatus Sungbacteria bacterium RIFCSPHIGHO2_02_FULL_51_29]OHA06440.1 MAG: hypothetical protein A3B29_04725 [Candidatus Sungbacteria bacterium RIFCSPLOWO2_01_FULL_51_34]OHA10378.1 MAG: hypothetical protein A3I44_06260 [Candidatus Sungbacteria bacterium RIFCSPLOWO2_02_FULL_51_17]